jgi:ADP-ribose pyrophosphatase
MDAKRLKREVLYRGRIFDLIVDEIQYPSGNLGIREIAHHPGGAVTVPLLDDGRVLLVKQLRYPLGEYIVELPAGKLGPGEDPAVCAARELTEETGWIAGRLTWLTSMYTTPGFCDEILHLYLATNLRESPEGHRREEGEFSMTVHPVPLSEAVAMIGRGEIRDGKTIVGLLMAEKNVGRK